ncbi:glycosyltransferase [Streptococcus parauberis]|uniref:Glycosyltransferase n=1 Tax=Streptococcus parauberis TaxID=1348 RepID=A0AAE4HW73_9STRE|nr:glycosyltransferase [Streptococcus parauberis]MDT2730991.1 glycosyltransferase [Streptococcus parauberis]PIO78745.1 putative glycosyltransferase EpsE [Streptococcus parauberis]POS66514.1 putative glycosyltransferase EpsE [Streptococcus parauberis]
MVKTAVLMATYNGQNFIEEQLDSIRNQTLSPDYVLMRDDGSSDKTIEVVNNYINRYNLSGWLIQRNEKNLGWRLNFRQLLIDYQPLDADFVFFSDQDDIWYLDKNERQVEIMENHPEIDLLSADIDIKLMSEDATEPQNYNFNDEKELSKYPLNFSYHNYRQGWTFCIRKELINLIMPYYKEGLILSHDNLMTGISCLIGKGFNYNRPVGVHKRHGGNASGNLLNMRSTNQRHISELKLVMSYYTIAKAVLTELNHTNKNKIEDYFEFNVERLKNAKQRRLFATIKQVLLFGPYYDSFSNRIRDLIFIFKK